MKDRSLAFYSGVAMATGLCFHFFGNELARASSVSLISAKEIGLDSSALTYTVIFGFPASALTLYLYSTSIRSNGAHTTFRLSLLICFGIFCAMTFAALSGLLHIPGVRNQLSVVAFYAFREIYSSLLSTQHWAFIVSSLDHKTSSYIVTFSGAVSVASTLGGFSVERVVRSYGVHGLLVASSLSVFSTFLCVEIAYFLEARKQHCALKIQIPSASEFKIRSTSTASATPCKENCTTYSSPAPTSASKKVFNSYPTLSDKPKTSMWREFAQLMSNSTLQLLVVEAVMHQCTSNMLNIMFYDGLRRSVTVNDTRAVLVGRFFALVNLFACVLQCFVIPRLLSHHTLPRVIMLIPAGVIVMTSICMIYPSLTSVLLSFGTLKVLEYAVLSGAMEMIYMPLDSEIRYLGKEYVRFFGSKLGKTGSSLLLSAITARLQPSLFTQCLWGWGFACGWGIVMSTLSVHLMQLQALSAPPTSSEAPTPRAADGHSNLNSNSSECDLIVVGDQIKSKECSTGRMSDLVLETSLQATRRRKRRARTISLCKSCSIFFAASEVLTTFNEDDFTSDESDTASESPPSEAQRDRRTSSADQYSPIGGDGSDFFNNGFRQSNNRSPSRFPNSVSALRRRQPYWGLRPGSRTSLDLGLANSIDMSSSRFVAPPPNFEAYQAMIIQCETSPTRSTLSPPSLDTSGVEIPLHDQQQDKPLNCSNLTDEDSSEGNNPVFDRESQAKDSNLQTHTQVSRRRATESNIDDFVSKCHKPKGLALR